MPAPVAYTTALSVPEIEQRLLGVAQPLKPGLFANLNLDGQPDRGLRITSQGPGRWVVFPGKSSTVMVTAHITATDKVGGGSAVRLDVSEPRVFGRISIYWFAGVCMSLGILATILSWDESQARFFSRLFSSGIGYVVVPVVVLCFVLLPVIFERSKRKMRAQLAAAMELKV